MRAKRNRVISVAGFDPTAGAGILADVKTFEQLGVDGFGVCTAVTLQTEDEFKGVSWIPPHQIELQLDTLMQKYEVVFLKIGLIQSLEILLRLTQSIKRKYSLLKIIWDPILKSSSGFQFHSELQEKFLYEILSQIFLITPNAEEAKTLMCETNSQDAARSIGRFCNVFMKSYLDEENNHFDLLIEDGKESFFRTEIIEHNPKHGSGCVLSAAITASLAKGFDLKHSCEEAKAYTLQFLKSTNRLLGEHRHIKMITQHA